MRCIALSTSIKADKFQAPLAVFQDFTHLTPQRVLELLEQHPATPKPSKQLANREYSKL